MSLSFGGEWDDPDLRDSAEIDSYFLEHFGKKTIQTDLAVTEKYRYVPEFETGGTFGVNMRDLNERILGFNYASIYQPVESRLRQHESFILNHYLKEFNEGTIKTKKFQHCGEPCPVVCKKLYDSSEEQSARLYGYPVTVAEGKYPFCFKGIRFDIYSHTLALSALPAMVTGLPIYELLQLLFDRPWSYKSHSIVRPSSCRRP